MELNVNQKRYSAITLIKSEEKRTIIRTLGELFQSIITDLKNKEKLGNAKVYRETYNSLCRYTQLASLDFLLSDVTIEWLNNYEKWLISSNNKSTTISLRFRTLRSVFNKALEIGSITSTFLNH